MRGIIVMAMFAVSLSHAGSQKYAEVRNLEMDASGLSEDGDSTDARSGSV